MIARVLKSPLQKLQSWYCNHVRAATISKPTRQYLRDQSFGSLFGVLAYVPSCFCLGEFPVT